MEALIRGGVEPFPEAVPEVFEHKAKSVSRGAAEAGLLAFPLLAAEGGLIVGYGSGAAGVGGLAGARGGAGQEGGNDAAEDAEEESEEKAEPRTAAAAAKPC